MAIEEIIISSAINSLGIMGVFLYLSHEAVSKFWKNVWLIGVFFIMAYSMGIERWSFQHLVVSTSLSDMSFGLLQIILYIIYIALAYLMFLFIAQVFKAAHNMITGVSSYGKTDKHEEYEVKM